MAKGIEIREAHFPGRAPVDSYGNGGFRFADMSHRGSIICLPSGVHGWDVSGFDEIDFDALAQMVTSAGDVDVLLLGCGNDLRPLPKAVREMLREAGISCDTMSTGAAVRTYNICLAEERNVAAALIAVERA